MKSVLEKLHYIEEHGVIYSLHYCNAGVGFCFFDYKKYKEETGYAHPSYKSAKELLYSIRSGQRYSFDNSWKKYLVTYKYYKTFEEAVEKEYERLIEGGD